MARHSVDSFPALSSTRRTLPHPDNNGSVVEIQFGTDSDTPNTQQVSTPQFDFFQPTAISNNTKERFDAIVADLENTNYKPTSGDVFDETVKPERTSRPQNIRQKIGAVAVGLRQFWQVAKRAASPKRGATSNALVARHGHFDFAAPYADPTEAEQAVYASLEAKHALHPIDNQTHYLFTHWGESPTGAFNEEYFGIPKHPHNRH